ncbi:MAG TPA: hypothetical protein DCW58_01325 [Candidatus Pacebacteria bacterium]|nr:hypothetical protein [Candidatus Paceibacterota bacterium]
MILRPYAALPHLSMSYSPLEGKFLRITHPSATRIPRREFTVRLACLRHTASIHPEPGSNS